jgi:type III pantothenate kinase
MLFVIDIGNTHTVAGIFQGSRITHQWRIKTDPLMTADELGICYHNLFRMSGLDVSRINAVAIASVVPQLEAAYLSCCNTLYGETAKSKLIWVTSDNVKDLISIRLDNPGEVGADRLVNGIAAYALCQAPVIVIDFGTAITFDCISGNCEYLGGLILPGLSVSLRALTQQAAKLPPIDISIPPEKVIGTSTVSAMKSGVLNGYGVMVEGLIDKVKQEMDPGGALEISVLATGGMSAVIQPYARSIERVEPNLTLNGLAIIHQNLDS